MNVYDTGRDLLAAGVIPLEDMLGETALVEADVGPRQLEVDLRGEGR